MTDEEIQKILMLVIQAKEEAGQPVAQATIITEKGTQVIDNTHNIKKEGEDKCETYS